MNNKSLCFYHNYLLNKKLKNKISVIFYKKIRIIRDIQPSFTNNHGEYRDPRKHSFGVNIDGTGSGNTS